MGVIQNINLTLFTMKSTKSLMKRMYHKALSHKTIPSRISDAEYAVRGKLPLHGEKIA